MSLEYDPLREYDLAVVNKLKAVVNSTPKPHYEAPVLGIAAPVNVYVGLPEDWFTKFDLPGINVLRKMVTPAPSRRMPNFRGIELSTNPATPNTFNIQKDLPQPVNILYDVELVAASQAHMNALVMHLLKNVPSAGFGTFLTVDGETMNYESAGMRDETNLRSRDGRQLVQCFTYRVEGWFIPSLECEKVPQILSVDIALETHRSRNLHVTPPVAGAEADEVVHIIQGEEPEELVP